MDMMIRTFVIHGSLLAILPATGLAQDAPRGNGLMWLPSIVDQAQDEYFSPALGGVELADHNSMYDASSPSPPSPCGCRVGPRHTCSTCYQHGIGTFWDNTELFFVGDAWQSMLDDEHSNNFGLRSGFNSAFALGSLPMRGQIGASAGYYDWYGRHEVAANDVDATEEQVFITAGLYRRGNVFAGENVSWGIVYDQMLADDLGTGTDEVKVGQLRGVLGYAVNPTNEFGTWFAVRMANDIYQPGWQALQPVQINATEQYNFFWRHHWLSGSETMTYIGFADNPGDVVFGMRGIAPLNRCLAIFGNFHYISASTAPGDIHPDPAIDTFHTFSETAWNVTFGVAFYPGGKAASPSISGWPGLPLVPVADNGTFNLQVPINSL